MTFERGLQFAVWGVVVASALTAVGAGVVLLKGDPTYLVQSRSKGDQPLGPPAPVSFPSRAFATTVLLVGMVFAIRRALSDASSDLRLPVVIGFALWLIDGVVFAATHRLFPAALVVPWLVLRLLVVLYSEPISDLLSQRGPVPAWAIRGLGLLVLLSSIVCAPFFRPDG
ncbi:MAG: hypothetical protein L0241_06120 [Planctomycetia bacterium]|nr:hypothetical protein [Planctomycetia bacterium]